MKSIRKRAATLEYIKSIRDNFVKHGGKSLQHAKGSTTLRYYVGEAELLVPTVGDDWIQRESGHETE